LAAGVTDHFWSVANEPAIIEAGRAGPSKAWGVQETSGFLTKRSAHMTRYLVRRQENGKFCVWDTKADKPAEEASGDLRYIDLQLGEAFDCAGSLNRDKGQNSN